MAEKCPSCSSCGFPMEKPEHFSMGDPKSIYCAHCTDRQGNLLPYETVLEANAKFYVDSQGVTPEAGNRMARALLANMPAWKSRAG